MSDFLLINNTKICSKACLEESRVSDKKKSYDGIGSEGKRPFTSRAFFQGGQLS